MQVTNYAALVLSFISVETAESDFVGKTTVFANQLAQVFIPGMKYADYTVASKSWREAYAENKKCSEAAAQAAFERAIARMNKFLESTGAENVFKTPKADNEKAVKTAAKREAEKKEAQSRLGQIGITADMSSAEASAALAKAKAKKISDETCAAALAFIAGKAKEETKEKAKKKDDERKALAKKVHEYLKNAPYEKVVEEAKRLGLVK